MAEVVYLNMQSGNGGIVVDVSRTGLGFQAACPILPDEPMAFRFSSDSIENIEVTGDLVWTDSDRKRGGLRFGSLPVEVRQQIQRWLDEPESQAENSKDRASHSPLRSTPPPPPPEPVMAHRSVAETTASSGRMWEAPPQRAQRAAAPAPVLPELNEAPPPPPRRAAPSEPPRSNMQPEFVPSFPRRQPIWDDIPRSRSTGATIALTAIFAILATIVVLSIVYRKEAGETFIQLGQMILGQGHEQSAAVTGPAQNAPAATPNAPSGAPATSQNPGAPKPDASNSGQSASDSHSSADSGTNQPAQQAAPPNPSSAQQPASADTKSDSGSAQVPASAASANGSAQTHNTDTGKAASPATSVEKPKKNPQDQGDGKTELALARDYLERGSPKSRDVAIQLLWVAVGDGNTDAEIELADLYLTGEDGVNRNCTQARILLRAAADTGNEVASQRLSELPNYGCR